MAREINIYDLARQLGISSGTVSRALNDRKEVSAATRTRVLEAAKRLGYVPSPLARGLATREASVIAIMLPSIADPFFMPFAKGVQDIARANGYAVMLSFADGGSDAAIAAATSFAQHRVAGVLILGGASASDTDIAEILGSIPTVAALRRVTTGTIPSVYIDHAAGTRAMVDHLVAVGRRRIAYVGLPDDSVAAIERRHGFHDAMTLNRMPVAGEELAPGGSVLDGMLATSRLLDTVAASGLDAICFASDTLAIGGMHSLATAGVSIPSQVAVAGFGDISFAEASIPPLTTIRVPMEQVGIAATELLLRTMSERDVSHPDVEMAFTVVERESTLGGH